MKIDYIVVGSGLAGIMFCEELRANNKSFVLIDDASQQSSTVAGGLYNPVVLKRFTPVWKSKEQLALALPKYKLLESDLDITLDYKIPIYRLFASVEEQNNWYLACDKPALSDFLSTNIITDKHEFISCDYGFGEVLDTGRIDTGTLIKSYKAYLSKTNQFLDESFIYDRLIDNGAEVHYKNITANQIVFAEGYGVKNNPYFKDLPLNGTKGELLTIHAPDLKIDYILKSSAFLIPLRNDKYILGATYEWKDKTNNITVEAKEELLNKLKTFLKCDFTVISQVAGIRPTVIDRRPLVGQHLKHKNMYVLNGLGTRGVMIAPYVAQQLYKLIEDGVALENEIDINRFY